MRKRLDAIADLSSRHRELGIAQVLDETKRRILVCQCVEKVRLQSLSHRHIQTLNPSKGPDWGLFSFCFKRRWPGHPPFGDRALDAKWVSEWHMSLFERPSTAAGRRKTFPRCQWVAALMGSSCSRDNPVTETDTKAQGGQKDGSGAADH
jgi:hypothetical protein